MKGKNVTFFVQLKKKPSYYSATPHTSIYLITFDIIILCIICQIMVYVGLPHSQEHVLISSTFTITIYVILNLMSVPYDVAYLYSDCSVETWGSMGNIWSQAYPLCSITQICHSAKTTSTSWPLSLSSTTTAAWSVTLPLASILLTHWGWMTQICVFNTRLFSLHNTLNL